MFNDYENFGADPLETAREALLAATKDRLAAIQAKDEAIGALEERQKLEEKIAAMLKQAKTDKEEAAAMLKQAEKDKEEAEKQLQEAKDLYARSPAGSPAGSPAASPRVSPNKTNKDLFSTASPDSLFQEEKQKRDKLIEIEQAKRHKKMEECSKIEAVKMAEKQLHDAELARKAAEDHNNQLEQALKDAQEEVNKSHENLMETTEILEQKNIDFEKELLQEDLLKREVQRVAKELQAANEEIVRLNEKLQAAEKEKIEHHQKTAPILTQFHAQQSEAQRKEAEIARREAEIARREAEIARREAEIARREAPPPTVPRVETPDEALIREVRTTQIENGFA